MATTFSTDMLYTRPGASESNVLSAHDPLIWEFADGAIAATPTATVQIVVKNNAAATIYTSAVFPAYLLSFSAPTAKFRFDATQIIKHIINNYFYKETSEIVEPENYGSKIEVTFKTYDNAVLEDTEVKTYFASHALNQIGDEYGANIPRLFLNDTEEIAHHMGFPNHLFFYAPTTLATYTPLVEVFEDEPENLITALVNSAGDPYDTFTVVGTAVSEADAAVAYSIGESDEVLNFQQGDIVEVIVPELSFGASGPLFWLGQNAIQSTIKMQAENGYNAFVFTIFITQAVKLYFSSEHGSAFQCAEIQVREVIDASSQGTLGLYMHSVDLAQLLLTRNAKTAKVYHYLTSHTLIKTYNLTIFEPCEGSIYVRFLTKDGYYMYWAFTPYKVSTTEGEKMNSVINSFSEMALANSRNYPIGYKNSFNKIVVSAAAVPIVFQRKLMEMFTSPAVYLWQGGQTPEENLIYTLVNIDYTIFTVYGTVILRAFASGTNQSCISNTFKVTRGEVIQVITYYCLTGGYVSKVYLVNEAISAIKSNEVNFAAGINVIELTATATDTVRIQILNTGTTDFSTSRIVVKRAEMETDWILLDKVEGSHNLREKNNFDSFNATLVLPENYTQTLGRVDV